MEIAHAKNEAVQEEGRVVIARTQQTDADQEAEDRS